ncbi:MAG: hypothetical protein H6716_17160 [Polyangiaceae bacterium]|nr:hypothetical protein [Polyangiaceae bacterium]
MKYLPAETQLPDVVLPRTHSPPVTDYRKYRNCLRWEFGFTCSFCFLHEQDWSELGVEGLGLTWVEHQRLKGKDKGKRDDFGNCLLSCRLCNNSRGTLPEEAEDGSMLLDPTQVAWGSYFFVQNWAMEVTTTSVDASYTFRAYNLGDRRKASLRRERARRFDAVSQAREEVAELLPRLIERARAATDPAERREALRIAEGLKRGLSRALAEIARYRAVPTDAPGSCLCEADLTLPSWLEGALQDI